MFMGVLLFCSVVSIAHIAQKHIDLFAISSMTWKGSPVGVK